MHEDATQGLESPATTESESKRNGIRVVCRDCDFEEPRWHPDLEGFEGARHGHDLRTDHEVAYEATNDRVRTDGGEDEPTGTLILVDQTGRSLTWHHSVEFDGYVHTTACDRVIDCDDIRDVEMGHPREAWRKNVTPNNGCPTCHRSVHEDLDVRTDGGQVEACPNCDSPRINERVSDRYDDHKRYRCVECHATFPDPVFRTSRLPENRTYTDTYRALRSADDLDDLRADGGVDMVDACPECDSAMITKHVGGLHRPIDDPPSYRCRDCKTLFDEPVQREPRRDVESVGNLSEAGRALLDADPDDFPIRTDGGSIADDLDELCSVDGEPLKRRDTVEHLDLGPLTVKQRLQTGPESARIRFDVESTIMKRPRLIVEYTLRELREEWGKTVHSDPTVLVSGGDGDDGDDLVTDGGTTTSLPDPVCEFCGEAIRKPAQRCPALDNGRCQP